MAGTNGEPGIQIYDISNPYHPAPASSPYDTEDYAFGIKIRGDYGYIADGNNFRIMDISDPEPPLPPPGNPDYKDHYWCETYSSDKVVLRGDYAYCSDLQVSFDHCTIEISNLGLK